MNIMLNETAYMPIAAPELAYAATVRKGSATSLRIFSM